MVRFIFLRHGYSVTNKTKHFTGQMDAPLDELGHRQAKAVANYIVANYAIDVIYSSDLCRAMDTARPTAELLGLPIHEEPAFREIDVGSWQGMAFEDIHPTEDYKALTKDPWRYPYGQTGECYEEVALRAIAAVERIAAVEEGKTVLIALHGGTLRAMLYQWGGRQGAMTDTPIVSNASVTVADYENGKISVSVLGEDSYLADLTTAYFAAH